MRVYSRGVFNEGAKSKAPGTAGCRAERDPANSPATDSRKSYSSIILLAQESKKMRTSPLFFPEILLFIGSTRLAYGALLTSSHRAEDRSL